MLCIYIFFQINGRLVTLPQQLKNEVSVQLTEDALTIEKKDSLRVSFSLLFGLTVSVNDQMAQKVCGACGKDAKVFDVQNQGIQEFLALWRAPDFPSALC